MEGLVCCAPLLVAGTLASDPAGSVPILATSFGWTTAVASGVVFAVVAAALWFAVRPDMTLQDRARQNNLDVLADFTNARQT